MNSQDAIDQIEKVCSDPTFVWKPDYTGELSPKDIAISLVKLLPDRAFTTTTDNNQFLVKAIPLNIIDENPTLHSPCVSLLLFWSRGVLDRFEHAQLSIVVSSDIIVKIGEESMTYTSYNSPHIHVIPWQIWYSPGYIDITHADTAKNTLEALFSAYFND